MEKVVKKSPWLLVAPAAILIILLACGGGGGGSTTRPDATVSSATAEQAVSMVEAIANFSNESGFNPLSVSPSGSAENVSILNGLGPYLLELAKAQLPIGNETFTTMGSEILPAIACDSGTEQTTVTWEGPDVATCDQMINALISTTFEDCVDSSSHANGVLNIQLSGDYCPSVPEDKIASIQLLSFSMTDTSGFSFSMTDLKINYDYIYSGSTLVGVTTTYNGDIDLVIDGTSFVMEFANFVFTMTETGPDTEEITISGSLTGSCLDGWITLETLATIMVDSASDCPTDGSVRVSGNGEATVNFNPDDSVDIVTDGGTISYPSCNDMTDGCV